MFAVLRIDNDGHRTDYCPKMKTIKCDFVCRYCQRRFNKPYGLMMHERTHKQPSQSTYACEICGRTYKRTETLRQHRASHCYDGFYRSRL